jgi:transketolase
MTIIWAPADSKHALEAMAAVEQALVTGGIGADAAQDYGQGTQHDQAYLTENLEVLHNEWAVDPQQIVVSTRPYAAWAINRFQRLVRRTTWWYMLPQWLQINTFHGATVRVIDALLARQRSLQEQLLRLENTQMHTRTEALEQQLQLLRGEQLMLQQRIEELEQRLNTSQQHSHDRG